MTQFEIDVLNILGRYGLLNDGPLGAVFGINKESMYKCLRGFDPDVELGIETPTYDYIVITMPNPARVAINECLTKLNSNGILICRDNYDTYVVRKGEVWEQWM